MTAKKYMIRANELVYFSQEKGFMSVPKTQHNFKEIFDYILSDQFNEEEFFKLVNQRRVDFEKESNGKFKVNNGVVTLENGVEIPDEILQKIEELKSKGYKWRQYENFWSRCLKNPNNESVKMLFNFIQRQNLTICDDGCFIAYKGVTEDLKDVYTGTIDNSPGKIVKMPREDVAFDPNTPCHTGLHCGSLDYAIRFGRIVVTVKVDPANVVSVPNDCNYQKIRTCEYEVKEIYLDSRPIPTYVVSDDLTSVEVDNTRKGAWSQQEIDLLVKLCNLSPRPSWKDIGERIMRSSEACRKKWESIN